MAKTNVRAQIMLPKNTSVTWRRLSPAALNAREAAREARQAEKASNLQSRLNALMAQRDWLINAVMGRFRALQAPAPNVGPQISNQLANVSGRLGGTQRELQRALGLMAQARARVEALDARRQEAATRAEALMSRFPMEQAAMRERRARYTETAMRFRALQRQLQFSTDRSIRQGIASELRVLQPGLQQLAVDMQSKQEQMSIMRETLLGAREEQRVANDEYVTQRNMLTALQRQSARLAVTSSQLMADQQQKQLLAQSQFVTAPPPPGMPGLMPASVRAPKIPRGPRGPKARLRARLPRPRLPRPRLPRPRAAARLVKARARVPALSRRPRGRVPGGRIPRR